MDSPISSPSRGGGVTNDDVDKLLDYLNSDDLDQNPRLEAY